MEKFKIFFGHWQAIFLLPAAFFLWNAIDGFYGYSISERSLNKFNGEVIYIDASAKVENVLILKLSSNQNHTFNLKDKKLIKLIAQNIKVGDNLNVYPVPRLYDNPKTSAIVKIVKGNELIINLYGTSKKVSLNLALIFSSLFLVVLIPYLFKHKKLLLILSPKKLIKRHNP